MTNPKEEITRRIGALVGLEVSGVHNAAAMLTLQFGPLRTVPMYRGTVKQAGAWALHIQCGWQVERDGSILATQESFHHSDDETSRAVQKINEVMVTSGAAIVEHVEASESGGVCLFMSSGLRLAITPSGVVGEEDWRFFSPGVHAKHFVIEGGAIDPDSLS